MLFHPAPAPVRPGPSQSRARAPRCPSVHTNAPTPVYVPIVPQKTNQADDRGSRSNARTNPGLRASTSSAVKWRTSYMNARSRASSSLIHGSFSLHTGPAEHLRTPLRRATQPGRLHRRQDAPETHPDESQPGPGKAHLRSETTTTRRTTARGARNAYSDVYPPSGRITAPTRTANSCTGSTARPPLRRCTCTTPSAGSRAPGSLQRHDEDKRRFPGARRPTPAPGLRNPRPGKRQRKEPAQHAGGNRHPRRNRLGILNTLRKGHQPVPNRGGQNMPESPQGQEGQERNEIRKPHVFV